MLHAWCICESKNGYVGSKPTLFVIEVDIPFTIHSYIPFAINMWTKCLQKPYSLVESTESTGVCSSLALSLHSSLALDCSTINVHNCNYDSSPEKQLWICAMVHI